MRIKKTLLCLAAFVIFCTIQAGSLLYVAASENRVFDEAGLFTEQEKETLQETIESAIQKTGMDLAVLTTEDTGGKSTNLYADDYYEERHLGTGKALSGALCLIDMDNRELTISTDGDMIRILTDERIDRILDNAIGYVGDGEYAKAIEIMLSDICDYVEAGIPSNQHNYDSETGAVSVYHRRSITWFEALFAIVAAGAVAGLACLSVVKQYRMESEQKQALKYHLSYRASSAFAFTVATDLFLNKMVSQRRIVQSSNKTGGSSRSSSAGRSTTHRSSSGRSHGGGSRRF